MSNHQRQILDYLDQGDLILAGPNSLVMKCNFGGNPDDTHPLTRRTFTSLLNRGFIRAYGPKPKKGIPRTYRISVAGRNALTA